jgi:Ni/Fe-hydrogenase 1 B-type cytochrome subunit
MTQAALETVEGRSEIIRVYVWELPVRIAHWLIVFSIAVLSVTGIYIGHPFLTAPGPAGQSFVMGTVRVVHFYAAIVFTLSVLSRVAWMFLGNRYSHWDEFIPVAARRRKGVLPMIKFYLFAVAKPPSFVGHNPLAGLTYSFVFLVYFVMIATGLATYAAHAAVDSPFRVFAFLGPVFGGLQTARWIHHVGMWLLIGFAVHHVYSAVMMSLVEPNATVESMFSGNKYLPREDLAYSGYRFVEQKGVENADA